jgi:hypothetical protein
MIGAQGESWASLCMGREQLESPQHARRIEQVASEHRDHALLQLPCISRLAKHLLHHTASSNARPITQMLFVYCAATSTRASL